MTRRTVGAAVSLAIAVAMATARPTADTVAVQYPQGTARGFLALRTAEGRFLASGEQVQVARGTRITKRLTFRFTDGSIDDETTVFAQNSVLRLIDYRHIQKGPAFPHPSDLNIDATAGRVTVRYTDDDGTPRTEAVTLDLPADLSNGLMTTILENVRPAALPLTVSYVAATPKPRIIKLEIRDGGLEPFSAARATYQARHYVVEIHIGGIEGVVGSLVGKNPPDSHVWISNGVPAFVRSETTFFMGAPMWRVDAAAPTRQGRESDR